MNVQLAAAAHTADAWERLQDLAERFLAYLEIDEAPVLAITVNGQPASLTVTTCFIGPRLIHIGGQVVLPAPMGSFFYDLEVTDPDLLQAAIGPVMKTAMLPA